jgi:hypothetical protein
MVLWTGPKPFPPLDRTEGATAAMVMYAGLLETPPFSTTTAATPAAFSHGTWATIVHGLTENRGAGRPAMVTEVLNSVIGHGTPEAAALPEARLLPLMVNSPPGATLAGAGAIVKEFNTPRGSITGPAGACARAVPKAANTQQRPLKRFIIMP